MVRTLRAKQVGKERERNRGREGKGGKEREMCRGLKVVFVQGKKITRKSKEKRRGM